MRVPKSAGVLIVFLLILSVLAGCGSSNNSGNAGASGSADKASEAPSASSSASASAASASPDAPDTSKPVKLKMILVGDTPTDVQLVYDELNKKLEQDINATVDVQFLSWADYAQKYPLILASGEDYDLIFASNWTDYFKNAANGAFLELTPEMLQKYAPQTVQNTPQDVLDSALVGGKLYALPMNYKEVTVAGYVVRGDLMNKYGVGDIKNIDDFGTYLDAIKKNEPDMIPWDTGAQDQGYSFNNVTVSALGHKGIDNPGYLVANSAEDSTLLSLYEQPETKAYFQKMIEWRNKGYWSKNALVNKTPARDSFVSGKSAAFIDNLLQASSTYTSLQAQHADWDVRFYPAETKQYFVNPYISNGVAINAKSKNPERALMFLDLLRNDKWYNQLTTYGIQGKHWDLKDGKLVSLPDSANFGPDSACPWGWRDSRFYLTPDGSFSNYDEALKNAQDNAIATPLSSFVVDKSKGNLQSIEAALTSLKDQYIKPLFVGYSNDLDKDLAKLKSEIDKAGFPQYLQEYQSQLNAYLGK